LILGSAALRARTWTVDDDGPADFMTIQAAIDAAGPGDLVSVAPGLYREAILLKSGVGVVGAGVAVTTIDGGQVASVIKALGCDSTTRIEGFTITRGQDQAGGGVLVRGGAPVITRNTILGNSAVPLDAYSNASGGGIALFDSQAVVRANTIASNVADFGGGVEIDGGSPRVERNTLTGNTAGAGGGLDAYLSSDGTVISGNTVTSNTATFGGGLEIAGFGSAVVTNNVIDGNTATGGGPFGAYGGGVDVYYSSPVLANNTIANNRASYGGGASILDDFGASVVVNAIVYGNRATKRGAGLDLQIGGGAILNDLFFQNQPDACGGPSASLCSDPTSLYADPLLVDPGRGDFRLRAESPAIDTGTSRWAPPDDARGQRRPLDGDRDWIADFDRGAREFDRNEVLGLTMIGTSGFTWEPVQGAASYHVYSGALSSLVILGADVCRDRDDPDRTDLFFPEVLDPVRGDGFAYLVTAVIDGAEQSPGYDDRGVERVLPATCP
jgi:hypothetical protein